MRGVSEHAVEPEQVQGRYKVEAWLGKAGAAIVFND